MDNPVLSKSPGQLQFAALRAQAWRYAVAVGAVVVAMGTCWALKGVLDNGFAFITFTPAVAVVGMVAGGRAGLVATALSAAAVDWMVLRPRYGLGVSGMADFLALSLFVITGVLISVTAGMLGRARRRELETAQREELLRSEERQRVAAVQAAERQRFQDLLNRLPVYVALLSPDYRVPFANRFFEERFGKSQGRRCFEYLFNLGQPCENCETFKVLKTKAPHDWEWQGPDGRNYEIHDSLFTDADGSEMIMEVGIDVTERKRAEAAVRAERQRFMDMLDTLPVVINIIRADHRIDWCNRAYREALGDNQGRVCFESQFGLSGPCDECQAFVPLKTGRPHHWEWTLPNGRTYDIYNFPFAAADGSPAVLEMDIDITDRRKAEAALKEAKEGLERRVEERTAELAASEAKYRSLFQNIEEIVTVYAVERDGNGRIVESRLQEANPAFLRAVGVASLKEIRGKTSSQILGKVWLERHLPAIQRAMNAGQVQVQEAYRPESGRHYITSIVRLDAETYIGTGWDITEIKRADEALRDHRELLETVINSLPMQVNLIRGSDLRLQFVNPAYQALAPGKQMVGKTLDEVWPETGQGFAALCRKVLETGETYQVEDELNRIRREPDGPLEERFFSWSLHRVRLPGENGWGILNPAWDTTDRKRADEALRRSEERFRVAQELSPDGFSILRPVRDGNGKVADFTWVYENPAAARFTGKAPEALIGRRLLELFPGHQGTEFLKAYQEVAETGERRVFEATYGRETVAPRWFRVAVVPVGSDIAVLAQDITERKEFQAELERLVAERTARLQDLVGELEHFSYTITHDMRSPLRAMRGFSEIVNLTCEECARKEPKEFLRKISNSAERMDRLITDALNYSRTVRQELPVEDVDTGKLLREMLDTYPELQASKAHVEVDGRLPVVAANEAGLTQCFSNLLGNAVKFVKPGEVPHIRIRAEVPGHGHPAESHSSDGADWVRIWVEDKGIGISKEMLPRVFDMFSRGSRDYDGTGIGLALVRKVAQRMGGRVGVESEEGQGSRFWLELRCCERP